MWIVIPRGHPFFSVPPPPKDETGAEGTHRVCGNPTLQPGVPGFLSLCHASLGGDHRARAWPCSSGTAVLESTCGRQDTHVVTWLLEKSSVIAGNASGCHPARAETLLPCGVLSSQNLALPLVCCRSESEVRLYRKSPGWGLWGLTGGTGGPDPV